MKPNKATPMPGDEFMIYDGIYAEPGHGGTSTWTHYFIGEHGGIAEEQFEITTGSIIRVVGECELLAPRTEENKKLLEVVVNDKYRINVNKDSVYDHKFVHCNSPRLVRYYGKVNVYTCKDCARYKKCKEYTESQNATEKQVRKILGAVAGSTQNEY